MSNLRCVASVMPEASAASVAIPDFSFAKPTKLEDIRVGMTKEQVAGIAGEPLSRELYSTDNLWFYYTDPKWYDGNTDGGSSLRPRSSIVRSLTHRIFLSSTN